MKIRLKRFLSSGIVVVVVLASTALLVSCADIPGASSSGSASASCPSDLKGNECAYYQDGYAAGAKDGKASMSMAYERYQGAYDSRFEPYFARGYEAGWRANR